MRSFYDLRSSSKIIVLVAQPILTDGGPPAWAVDKRAEHWADQVAGDKGGPPSVKVAHVYLVLRYPLRTSLFIIGLELLKLELLQCCITKSSHD